MSNIDIESVNKDINFIKKLIDDNSIEIKGISYGKQFRILRTIENILSEREQDNKIIKELEAKLEFKNWGDLDNIQFEEYLNQFIPKQKVKDKIEEVHNMKFEDERLNSATIDFAVHKFEELLEDK